MATVAEQLGAFVVERTYEDLSEQARQQLKVHILDALGCAIGALQGPPIKALRTHLAEFGGQPLVSLIGGGKTAPDHAVLYNSSLVRYLDFNDGYIAKGETCHPNDNLGSVLASCEYARKSGKDLMTALAVAYQVQCRLSAVAPVRDKGFDHTTQGAFAVPAAVAKALGLDQEGVANAVALSGSSYIALRVTRTGTLTNWKGLVYPNMAFGATNAAFLAMRGITGPLEVFEGKGGLMDSITGPFELDWSKENLEAIVSTSIKKYNAEFHSQATLEGVLELRAANHIQPQDIKSVTVDTFDVAYNIIGGGDEGDKRHVQTKEEADHSLPYMVAAALIDGEVTPAQYTPQRILKPDVQDLLRKVTIRPDADMSSRFPAEMPCRIEITLNNGQTFTREKQDYEGFYTRPVSWEGITAKFDTLAAPFTTEAQRSMIVDIVAQLETKDVAQLAEALNTPFMS